MNKEKAKRILDALSGTSVDFSTFDESVAKLKSSLKDKIEADSLQDVKRQIEKFKKSIDFTPLYESINGVETKLSERLEKATGLLSEEVKGIQLNSSLTRKESEDATSAILTLKEEITSLKTVGDEVKLIKERLAKLPEFAERVNTVIASLKDSIPQETANVKDTTDAIEKLRRELNNRINNLPHGGGAPNRNISINGNGSVLNKYTDINLIGAMTFQNNNQTKNLDITFPAASPSVGGTVIGGEDSAVLFIHPASVLATDVTNFNYTTASGPRLQVGSGGTTSAGITLGNAGSSGFSGLIHTSGSLSTSNAALLLTSTITSVQPSNGSGSVRLGPGINSQKVEVFSTAGQGPSITAGTATTNVNALNISQTWNNAGIAFTGARLDLTQTAAAAGSTGLAVNAITNANRFLALNATGPGMNVALYLNGAGTYGAYNGIGSISGQEFGVMAAGVAKIIAQSTTGAGASIVAGTATTNVAALSVTQTWNNAGVTFTGILSNLTDTASNAASLLMDLQVGGATRMNVTKGGTLTTLLNIVAGGNVQVGGGSNGYWDISGPIVRSDAIGYSFSATTNASAGRDTNFSRTAAATVALGNGTAANASGTLNLTTLNAGVTNVLKLDGANNAGSITLQTTNSFTNSLRVLVAAANAWAPISALTFATAGTGVVGFSATSNPETPVAGFSYGGASNTVALGNGTAGNTTGTLILTNLQTETLNLQDSGAAATVGNAVLVGGTVTVSTTAVTTGDIVMLTRKTSGGTIGTAITYTINTGVSFTITSDNILDTSTFSWMVVKTH